MDEEERGGGRGERWRKRGGGGGEGWKRREGVEIGKGG